MQNVQSRRFHVPAWHKKIAEFFTSATTSYRDTSARQNYIGAEAQAFDRRLLPYYLDKGPGEIVRSQLLAGAPQVYVNHTPVPTGIPGIAAGQIWNGGLIDNPLTNGGTNPVIV